MHAVARIAYAGDIDNIQVSWVKMGAEGARQVLAGRGQRPGRDPDGREHLAGGRARSTASAWASRSSRPSWRRSAARWCSAPPSTRGRGLAVEP